MWKEYSSGYLKKNRASSISVMTAAFISALLLSLLCSIFYNLWVYEIERIKTEEGDWQGRIVGEISEQDLGRIRNHANVEAAVINEDLSAGQETVVDLTFINKREVFEDLPRIADLVDGDEYPAVTYHYALLNMYLVRSAEDTALRWVFPFALAVTAAACLSLVLVIHNAFAVSMSARIHQFGILSSIGATPGQIRTCLLQEAFVLCAGPVLAGSLLGILVSMGMVAATNLLLADVEGRLVLPFGYHPLILCLSLLTTAVTLLVSAWIPARQMSRLKYRRAAAETKKEFQTVVTAVRNRGRAGRKCAESAAKSHAHRSLVAGFFLSGFFLYDVFYHDHGGQPAGDILRQIPGRLGRDGDDERYGPW